LIYIHNLFQVRTPHPGWPRTIKDLDFPSLSMVTNIRHTIGIATDQSVPMDTTAKETGKNINQAANGNITRGIMIPCVKNANKN